MTDNDFADPWGLPPTADDDDIGGEAPPEPPPAPEPVSEPAAEEPMAAESEPVLVDDDEPVHEEQPAAPTAIDVAAAEPDDAPDEAQPEAEEPPAPAASGPYSQVLAAASGLFGRSTSQVARPPVEIDEPVDDAGDTPVDDVVDDGSFVEDAVGDAAEPTVEDVGETAISIDAEDSSFDQVEEVLSSLGSSDAVMDADVEHTDGDDDDTDFDAPGDTVSVEQIAAMASQLEVETPEPFEVSFTTHDDEPQLPDTNDVVGDAGLALLGADGDEPEISIDMDSSPSVFEELSQEMDEPETERPMADETVPGGFDVGAVFHSEQADDEKASQVDDSVSEVDSIAADEAPALHDVAVTDSTDTDDELVMGLPTFDDSAGDDTEPFAEEDVVEQLADDEITEPLEDEPVSVEMAGEPAEAVDETAVAAVAATTGAADSEEDTAPSRFVDSGEVEWGARWHESAQGWVEDASGQATWRPIVTTASTLSEWEVDTYLGIVVGDSPVSTGAPMDTAMALSRQHAIRVMVDEALSRGAHAVIGVQLGVADVGSIPLATATGTAVTLKPGDA